MSVIPGAYARRPPNPTPRQVPRMAPAQVRFTAACPACGADAAWTARQVSASNWSGIPGAAYDIACCVTGTSP